MLQCEVPDFNDHVETLIAKDCKKFVQIKGSDSFNKPRHCNELVLSDMHLLNPSHLN